MWLNCEDIGTRSGSWGLCPFLVLRLSVSGFSHRQGLQVQCSPLFSEGTHGLKLTADNSTNKRFGFLLLCYFRPLSEWTLYR